jgi:hypothetical protein
MVAVGRIHISVTEEHADLLASIEKNYRIKPSEFFRLTVDYIIDNNTDLELWAHRERLKRIDKEQARVQARITEIETARPVSATPEGKFELPAPRKTVITRSAEVRIADTNHLGGTEQEKGTFVRLGKLIGEREASPKAKTWFQEHAKEHPQWLEELPTGHLLAIEKELGCSLRVVSEFKSNGSASPLEEAAK